MGRIFKCEGMGDSIENWELSMQENLDRDGALVIATTAVLKVDDVMADEYPPLRIVGLATREDFERQLAIARRHARPREENHMIGAPEGYRFYFTVVAD